MNSKMNIILLLIAFTSALDVKREIKINNLERNVAEIDEECVKQLAITGFYVLALVKEAQNLNFPKVITIASVLLKQIPEAMNVCKGELPSLNMVEAVDPQCFSQYIPELQAAFNQFNSHIQRLDIAASIADIDAIRAILVNIQKECDHSFNF